jgi:hypothetical protein
MSIFNDIQSLFSNNFTQNINNTIKYFQKNINKNPKSFREKENSEDYTLFEVEIVELDKIEGEDL